MMGLLARIAGPKVLLGVSGVSISIIGVLFWLLLDARDEAAQVEQRNVELRGTVSEQEQQQQDLLSELDNRDQSVLEAQKRRKVIDKETRRVIDDLQKALEDNSCANTEHPDSVVDGLRIGAGGKNGD